MQTLFFQLQAPDEKTAQLIYFSDARNGVQRESVTGEALSNLLSISSAYHLRLHWNASDLRGMGREIYSFLNGHQKKLDRLISSRVSDTIVLAIESVSPLTAIPWEIMHDGEQFIVTSETPRIIPVRWSNGHANDVTSRRRALRLLFMACAPQDVQPTLDYEKEEALILSHTSTIPLSLRVEESGSIIELGKVWGQNIESFDVLHLSGHASIQQSGTTSTDRRFQPYFITEDAMGKRFDATAEVISSSLSGKWPRLLFLSGCRTAESSDADAMPSLAEALLAHGARCILGWGRSVTDSAATLAAANLYKGLASGWTLPHALSVTYSQLFDEKVEDWHLLRLYVQGDCPAAFVEAANQEEAPQPEAVYAEFLDKRTNTIRVATPNEFVGRRQILQTLLRALHENDTDGVLLHGAGGVGKSTLAARLLDRLWENTAIVIRGQLDKNVLLSRLSEQCTSPSGQSILQSQLPLNQLLVRFLHDEVTTNSRPVTFVLDDFEVNLTVEAEGAHILSHGSREVLIALLESIRGAPLQHRAIITCRYDFTLLNKGDSLCRQPIPPLRGGALRKKCERLQSFKRGSKISSHMQAQAKRMSDGNPRLLEWFDMVLQNKEADPASLLETLNSTADEFLEGVLAKELLQRQPSLVRDLLASMLIYELPVPIGAVQSLFPNDLETASAIKRASSVGLLEVYNLGEELHYRVSRLIADLLAPPAHLSEKQHAAAKHLYEVWWASERDGWLTEALSTSDSKSPMHRDYLIRIDSGDQYVRSVTSEAQHLEVLRLAQLCNSKDMALEVAYEVSLRWIQQSRYRDALALCELTRKIFGPDYRLLNRIAHCETVLNPSKDAVRHFQEAAELCPESDTDVKPAILHNLGLLLERLEDLDGALQAYSESIAISEENHDLEGMDAAASTAYQIASIHVRRGEFEQAVPHLRKALDYFSCSGNHSGQSGCLLSGASIVFQQGDFKQAFELSFEAAEIAETTSDYALLGRIFHQIGFFYCEGGQWAEARDFLLRALYLKQRVGDARSELVTLDMFSRLLLETQCFEEAISHSARLVSLHEQVGDEAGKATALTMLGQAMVCSGEDVPSGLERLMEARQLFEELGAVEDMETIDQILSNALS